MLLVASLWSGAGVALAVLALWAAAFFVLPKLGVPL